jgi:hypothetical protein
MKTVTLILLYLLVGCSTGGAVVKINADTYLVANEQYGSSGSSQKTKAIQKAIKYCEKIDKTMEMQSTKQADGALGSLPSAEVTFSCRD